MAGAGGQHGRRSKPPGLRAQLGATRDAIKALVVAHIELAKTELGSIVSEVGKMAALGALAFGLVIAAVFLLVVGSALFLGEWLLGSMGWGVLHGFLAFIALAVTAVFIALGVSLGRIGRSLLIALVVGLLVGVILAVDLPNQLYAAIGDAAGLGVDPGIRPLIVGLLVGGLVGLIAGIVVAVLLDVSGGGRVAAVMGLTVVGVILGAVTAITFGLQVGAGLGFTTFYMTWIVVMGVDIARTGIDLDSLKARFYPVQTIDTSKETLEWLKKQMPPGIGS